MRAIMLQIKANMRTKKLQTALILLTLFCTAGLLTIALMTLSTRGAYDRLFIRTNGAHLWLVINPGHLSPKHVERRLASLPGVKAITGIMPTLAVEARIGGRKILDPLLRDWPGHQNVNSLLLVQGCAPRPGEIALDRNVADYHHAKLGDTVILPTLGGECRLKIAGLTISAESAPYPETTFAFMYLSPGSSSSMKLQSAKTWYIGLRLRDPSQWQRILQAAEEILPSGAIVYQHNWEMTRQTARLTTTLLQTVLLISFGIIAGLAAGLFMANAIAEFMRAQRRRIGLLKTVGFTKCQLAATYLLQLMMLTLFAGTAGLAAGAIVGGHVLAPMVARFGESLTTPPFWLAGTVILSSMGLTAAFTLWPIIRGAYLGVIEAIRHGAEAPRHPPARRHQTNMQPVLMLGVGSIAARPRRAFLTVLSLGLAVLALTFCLSLHAIVREICMNPEMGVVPDYDLLLTRSIYLPDTTVRSIINRQAECAAYYAGTESTVVDSPWAKNEFLVIRGLEGDLSAFRLPIMEGRFFRSPDEAVLAYDLAWKQHLRPGQTLHLKVNGVTLNLRVAGIIREFSNHGRVIYLPAAAFRRIYPQARFLTYLIRLRPGAHREDVARDLRMEGGGALEVGQWEVPEVIATLPRLVDSLALILALVAMISVYHSTSISVHEQRREFGIMKALGMTPGQIVTAILTGAAAMAAAGYALGLPLGSVAARILPNGVGRQMGFPPIDIVLSPSLLLALLPAVLLIAAAAALPPAWRAGKINAAKALKYE